MSFLDNVFGAAGCNPDGTVGQNAFTRFVDASMDGTLVQDQTQQMEMMQEMDKMELMQHQRMGGVSNSQVQAMPQQFSGGPMSGMSMFMPPAAGYMPPHMMMYPPNPYMMMHPAMGMQMPLQYQQGQREQPVTDDDILQDFHSQVIQQENQYLNATNWTSLDSSSTSTATAVASPQQFPVGIRTEDPSALMKDAMKASTAPISMQYAPEADNPYLDSAQSAADLLRQGEEYYTQGHIAPATLYLEAALQRQEEESGQEIAAEAWRLLGLCHAENDAEDRAIQCFERCQAADPYNTAALIPLAVSLFNDQRPLPALHALRHWLEADAKYAAVPDETASVDVADKSSGSCSSLGKADLLTWTLRRLQGLSNHFHGGDAQVLSALGLLHSINNEFDEAVDAFQRAVELQSEDHAAINRLAATLANADRSAEAVPLYARLLQLRPAFARGWMNLGVAYANLSEHEEAARAFVKALHLSPAAKHIWGYLRVSLSTWQRFDLAQLAGKEDQALTQLAQELKVQLD